MGGKRDIVLDPLQQETARLRKIAGFDFETSDANRKMELACVSLGPEPGVWIDPEDYRTFYDRESFFEFMEAHRMRDYSVWASNLEFDFFAAHGAGFRNGWRLFNNGAKWMHGTFYQYTPCKYCSGNGCHLEKCECKQPYCKSSRCHCGKVEQARVSLYDSFNIYRLPVEEMGKILLKISDYHARRGDQQRADYFHVSKMERPAYIGKALADMTEAQRAYYEDYNRLDAVVTRKFVEFMQDEFARLGTQLKPTTPSIAMDLWRRNHLDTTYNKPHRSMNANARKAYYGGRTEVLQFGYTEEVHSYDVKSMYPWAMRHTKFPNPNTLEFFPEPTRDLLNLEGVSQVRVSVPNCYLPPLPVRDERLGKVIFPVGEFSGAWTNIELRYAIQNCGVRILDHDWSIVSHDTCTPFDSFIDSLWDMRANFLAENNPAQLIVKLAMNSLYGKFGMNEDKDNVYEYLSLHDEEGARWFDFTDSINPGLASRNVVVKPVGNKPDFPFVNLFWASYVTGRARNRLHELSTRAMQTTAVFYKDTDSLYTRNKLSWAKPDEGAALGDLCEKGFYKSATFVAPKFYLLENTEETAQKKAAKWKKENPEKVAIKTFSDFVDEFYAKGLPPAARKSMRQALRDGDLTFHYQKFLRFKEAMRRPGMVPNEIVDTHKTFNPLRSPKRRLVTPIKRISELADKQIDSVPWNVNEIPDPIKE